MRGKGEGVRVGRNESRTKGRGAKGETERDKRGGVRVRIGRRNRRRGSSIHIQLRSTVYSTRQKKVANTVFRLPVPFKRRFVKNGTEMEVNGSYRSSVCRSPWALAVHTLALASALAR